MNVNQATIDLIKEFEGCKLKAYKCPAGIWTIGYGTTAAAGVGVEPAEGMTITKEEAEWYLEKAVSDFAFSISKFITAPINENQFGAFVSLAYNIGINAFKRSSALRHFNSGKIEKVGPSIKLWKKANGKVLNGLVRRREAEVALFMTLVPEVTVEPAPQGRSKATQSRTVQASVAQGVSAFGGALAALQALDGTAQIIVLVGCFAIVGLSMFILKERLKAWSAGWR